MENNSTLIPNEKQKAKYVKPCTEKHEPVKIVQGLSLIHISEPTRRS
jgi:hypothetical protein